MNFMTYNEFKSNVLKNIRDYLPEEFSATSIAVMDVPKEGGRVLDGLQISDPYCQVSPIIYLNDYYTDYVTSGSLSLSRTLQKIASDYMENRIGPDNEKFSVISDPSKIVVQFINEKINKNYLQDKVYDTVGEFAALYKVFLEKGSNGILTAPITRRQFDTVFACQGIKETDLFNLAMENTTRFFPPQLSSISDVLGSMCEEKGEKHPLYVLTNDASIYGATLAFNPDVKMAEETLGENFWVLPSSVHEVLLLGRNSNIEMSVKEGNAMISDINRSIVAPEERLSDQLYVFNSKERKLELASDFEEREKKNNVKKEKNSNIKPGRHAM